MNPPFWLVPVSFLGSGAHDYILKLYEDDIMNVSCYSIGGCTRIPGTTSLTCESDFFLIAIMLSYRYSSEKSVSMATCSS